MKKFLKETVISKWISLLIIFCLTLLVGISGFYMLLLQYRMLSLNPQTFVPQNSGYFETVSIQGCIWRTDSENCKNYLKIRNCKVASNCLSSCNNVSEIETFWDYGSMAVARQHYFASEYRELLPETFKKAVEDDGGNWSKEIPKFEDYLKNHSTLPPIPRILLTAEYVSCWKSQLYHISEHFSDQDAPATSKWHERLDCMDTGLKPKSCRFQLVEIPNEDALRSIFMQLERGSARKPYIRGSDKYDFKDNENNFDYYFNLDCLGFGENDTECVPRSSKRNETVPYTKRSVEGVCGFEFTDFQNALENSELDDPQKVGELQLTVRNFICCVQALEELIKQEEKKKLSQNLAGRKAVQFSFDLPKKYPYCESTIYRKPDFWVDRDEKPVASVLNLMWIYDSTQKLSDSEVDQLVSFALDPKMQTNVKNNLRSIISEALSINFDDISVKFPDFNTFDEDVDWKLKIKSIKRPVEIKTEVKVNDLRIPHLDALLKIKEQLQFVNKHIDVKKFPDLIRILLNVFKFEILV